MRYLLAAMKFSHFARFAYVPIHTGSPYDDVKEMKSALGVYCSDCENMFIFKEDPEKGPIAKV